MADANTPPDDLIEVDGPPPDLDGAPKAPAPAPGGDVAADDEEPAKDFMAYAKDLAQTAGGQVHDWALKLSDWYVNEPSILDRMQEADKQRKVLMDAGQLTYENDPGRAVARELAMGFAGGNAARGGTRFKAKPPSTDQLREGAGVANKANETASFGAGKNNTYDAAADMTARADKGKLIDDAINRAKAASGRVGFDSAIKREFENLGRQKNGQFTPAELEQIQSVARGGLLQRAFQALGELSPTANKINLALTGVAVGANALDLPGADYATGAAALGLAGRGASNRLAGRAANRAGSMVREGGMGLNAGSYDGLVSQGKALNDQISALIAKAGGDVPKQGTRHYPEYIRLRDERDDVFRHMRAMPRK